MIAVTGSSSGCPPSPAPLVERPLAAESVLTSLIISDKF